MKELFCIICPNSCKLQIEELQSAPSNERSEEPWQGTDSEIRYRVSGNQCPKGIDFAIGEMTNPVRTFSSTVATSYPECPVLPVRLSEPIPKNMIFSVMKEINKLYVDYPVSTGDILIKNVLNLGADVIVISDALANREAGTLGTVKGKI